MLALDAVLVRRRTLHHFKLGMRGENLIMDAADPMPPRTDFAVRHGEKIFAERRAEGFENLLWRIERNTSHQQELTTHLIPPSLASVAHHYTLAAEEETRVAR